MSLRVGIAAGAADRASLEFVRDAERLGADSLGFIPMHEYHDGGTPDSVIPERPWAAKMQGAVETLSRLKREREIIENSDGYIALFPRCFAGRPSPLRCHAPSTSPASRAR